ncbi:unnamed protein product [Ambrosiozyma monospora]|uniref:Unnamed protein product n=1 Tax=Ambrosiozyma monospora TaxID=43982 RepID=A0A9W6YVQ4_AMBMO|nr:unnamed protein product [Ambrosiozyma monospora]
MRTTFDDGIDAQLEWVEKQNGKKKFVRWGKWGKIKKKFMLKMKKMKLNSQTHKKGKSVEKKSDYDDCWSFDIGDEKQNGGTNTADETLIERNVYSGFQPRSLIPYYNQIIDERYPNEETDFELDLDSRISDLFAERRRAIQKERLESWMSYHPVVDSSSDDSSSSDNESYTTCVTHFSDSTSDGSGTVFSDSSEGFDIDEYLNKSKFPSLKRFGVSNYLKNKLGETTICCGGGEQSSGEVKRKRNWFWNRKPGSMGRPHS